PANMITVEMGQEQEVDKRLACREQTIDRLVDVAPRLGTAVVDPDAARTPQSIRGRSARVDHCAKVKAALADCELQAAVNEGIRIGHGSRSARADTWVKQPQLYPISGKRTEPPD